MNRHLAAASLLAGPLLAAVATFFWDGDRYGVTAGAILMYSTVAWIYGLLAVWTRIGERRPWLGALGALLALAGFAGGMAFSLQGFFEGLFDVSGPASLAAAADHPVAAALVLWIPGPAFPLALAALGAALTWTRLAPRPLALLLIAAAALFPLSRITRTDLLAHAADLLILTAFAALAYLHLRTDHPTPVPATP
ncbi:hypothetical protein [Glycomyces terrestris]|uniref:Uncharacterized protein n=1 Tax=Glycomyces terrestris TaxID=2493553 RepID=A0A426UZZ3_9ACTN|nr:hypothetical protein [Glycomyces terrestris]RRS00173.1 hypothetical protein EIW28_06145 [Glycomyces terrestris]